MFKKLLQFLKNLFSKSTTEEPERPDSSQSPVVDPIPEDPIKSEIPVKVEPVLAQKLLWYPVAKQVAKMPSRGKFAKGYPYGLIVHFNAGRNSATGTIDYGRTQGYNYLGMDREGQIYQPNPLNEWGYHAGTSSMKLNGKTVSSVSQYLIGIEICSAGRVEKLSKPEGDKKFKSWFGEKYTEEEIRYSGKKDNIQAGYYHKYTQKQEDALIAFCLWLKRNNPDVFSFDNVLGHDEVAPTRKNDPGAALSMSMPELRELLKKLYK